MSTLWAQLQSAETRLDSDESPHVQAFQRGMKALSAMQQDTVQQEEDMLSAASAFLEALMYQPEWAEALMGLSYWLYLVGDSASAMHYAERTLSQDSSREDAQDLLYTLQSVRHLDHMQDELASTEMTTASQPLLEVKRISLLLQVHHQLINAEIDGSLLQNEAQVHSRQSSLETLVQMLAMQLDRDFPDMDALSTQLETVSADLEKLKRLEQDFVILKTFRTEVQRYFSELTRIVIGLRMGQDPLGGTVAEALKNLKKLRHRYDRLKADLAGSPAHLQAQMRSLSGWEHVEQQYQQLKEMTP